MTPPAAAPPRPAARVVDAIGWLIVGPLLLAAAARVVAWDARTSLVVLNALTPFLYLPAWLVAVPAGVARRWPLLIGAATVVVAHLAFALPELTAAEDLSVAARTAPTFRVFSANVYARSRSVTALAAEIRGARPDVVLLQEATPAHVSALDATGVLAELPHRRNVPRSDPFGALAASRWPLTEDAVVTVQGRPIAIGATIEFNGTPVRVFGVHAVNPIGGARLEWIADLDHLADLAAAEPRPVLLAGDFNATWGHRAFRRLLDAGTGLTDAAAARGKPYGMTWSRDRGLVPPLVRIDHILTKGRLAVTRIAVGRGVGSDHRPLIADVAVLAR